MEWLTCIKGAIAYIEEHLQEECLIEDVAREAHVSTLYLQRGFQILTGYSVGEYIRNRRLYEAGREILYTDNKIIDIALKYQYETPESFSKAFSRFHGYPPKCLRKKSNALRVFHPIQIEIKIKGGNFMDFRIEELDGFQVIGLARRIPFETSYTEIPAFWSEVYQKITSKVYTTGASNAVEQAVLENRIGELGVCFGETGNESTFKYVIGGFYKDGVVPEGLEMVQIPKGLWAKFRCVGPLPKALQDVNTRIFKEWLPGNKDYEIAAEYNIEWYSSEKDMNHKDYVSEIWIPVKRK